MIKKYKYHLLVFLAGVSWSTLSIFSALASKAGIDPFNQVFWRVTIGILSSLVVGALIFRQNFFLEKRAYKYLVLNGFFLFCGYTTTSAAIFLGSPIAKAVALSYSYPLTVIVLSYFIFKNIPSFKNWLAVIISLVSVALLMEIWKIKSFTQINGGDLFAWLNSFAFGAIIVWGTKIRKDLKLNPFITLFYSFVFLIFFLIILGFTMNFFNLSLFNLTFRNDFDINWLPLIGLGTISSVLPISLMYFGSTKLKSFTTSILLLSEPVFVYFAGVFFFNQALSLWGILGVLGILISVLLT